MIYLSVGVSPGRPRLLDESDPAHGFGVRVPDPDRHGQPVLAEGEEPQVQLVVGRLRRHRDQVAAKLDKVGLALQNLQFRGCAMNNAIHSFWSIRVMVYKGFCP